MSVPVADPAPPRCPRCRTGRRTPGDLPAAIRRSRPRCGPASPPPAAPSRRSSPSSSSGSGRGRGDRRRAGRAARRSGRSSTTPTSRPAPCPRRRWPSCAGAAAWSCAATSTAEQALGWDRDIVDYVERNQVLRELPRPGRRLLRQRRLQARDLPDLLVARPDAGPAERPDGARAGASSTASGSTSPTACSGSTRTATRCTRTASAAARRAPTRAASAPTSTPAPSTCG